MLSIVSRWAEIIAISYSSVVTLSNEVSFERASRKLDGQRTSEILYKLLFWFIFNLIVNLCIKDVYSMN